MEANYHFGQINVLLVLMVLADLTLTLRVGRRRLPRGVLVGVAAAIKLIPLPKDPIQAFRGAGRGRYTSDKLIKDRRKERLEEDARDRKP